MVWMHFYAVRSMHHTQYYPGAHTTHASMAHRSLWQFRFSPCPYALRLAIGLERMGKKSASPIAPHRHHLFYPIWSVRLSSPLLRLMKAFHSGALECPPDLLI